MKRYSLVIGINNYQDERINNLECAVSDAIDLDSMLANAGRCQIHDENRILLYNEEATRKNIIEKLNYLSNRVEENDLVIFYFAGHGCSDQREKVSGKDDSNKKYIVPYDADIKSLDSTAIDFLFLGDRLEEIVSKRMVMMFDCCHSGSAGGRTFSVNNTRDLEVNVGTRYLERVSGKGRVIIAACSGKQVAKENRDNGHGVFTQFILKGLSGNADYKRDGYIDLEELWMYVQDRTSKVTNNSQNPVRKGEIEGEPIYLTEPIKINTSDENKAEVKKKIIDKFKEHRLQEVCIADSDEKSVLGEVAAKYLSEVALRNNSKIAVSCGRTLIETINKLPRMSVSNIEIFPLNGSPSDEVHLTDSMVLSYLLWSKFESDKALSKIVPTGIPLTLFKKVEEGIAELAHNVLKEAKEADVFLFGIGSPSSHNDNIPHLLKLAGLTSEDLKNIGVVGELNFHVFDKEGKFLALDPEQSEHCKDIVEKYSSKFYSLSPRDFMEVTKRPGIDIIAVSGGRDKREAIAAAIRGNLIRTLITDMRTANWLANIYKDDM